MTDIMRRCHGNQNEDVIDIRPVFGEAIIVKLIKENGLYAPMALKDKTWARCEYLTERGFCKANPEKHGYCPFNKSP